MDKEGYGAAQSELSNNSGLSGRGFSFCTSGFRRVSLRAILMNSPFSRRTKARRHRNTNLSGKSKTECEISIGSCSSFKESKNESNIKHTKVKASLFKNSSLRRATSVSGKESLAQDGGISSGAVASSSNCSIQGMEDILLKSDKRESWSSETMRECPLCLQEVPPDSFPHLLTCDHSSCLSCFKQYLTVEITELRVNVNCPQCNELMHPTDIHRILENETISAMYEEFMLRRVLSTDPDTRWCPAADCGYAVIASGCAGCPKLKCERPGCGSDFCYHCKAEWHPNQTCDMARAQRSPNNLVSSLSYISEIQIGDDVKVCPRCQVLIMKMDDGSCNHMTCSVCGAEFCWLCMKEISDLHYLSPSGCTFWGKKPWSRKKKIMWQLGTLIGAPLGISLIAGLAVPAMIIGIPVWVGRKIHARYSTSSRHKRNLMMIGGVTASALVSPVLAGVAVGLGVPILLAYIYGVVPISLFRSGGCGVTTSASGVRIAFDDENDVVIGLPGRQSEPSQAAIGTASIGEMSCGASLSADSAAHALAESDRESASNTAIAPASLTGSIASSCFSRTHRMEVHVDVSHGSRHIGADSLSEKSNNTLDTENASVKALAGSLIHCKINEAENRSVSYSSTGILEDDSGSEVLHTGGSSLTGGSFRLPSRYLHAVQTSASENNSVVLPSDLENCEVQLDSVSAIINANHLSSRLVSKKCNQSHMTINIDGSTDKVDSISQTADCRSAYRCCFIDSEHKMPYNCSWDLRHDCRSSMKTLSTSVSFPIEYSESLASSIVRSKSYPLFH